MFRLRLPKLYNKTTDCTQKMSCRDASIWKIYVSTTTMSSPETHTPTEKVRAGARHKEIAGKPCRPYIYRPKACTRVSQKSRAARAGSSKLQRAAGSRARVKRNVKYTRGTITPYSRQRTLRSQKPSREEHPRLFIASPRRERWPRY